MMTTKIKQTEYIFASPKSESTVSDDVKIQTENLLHLKVNCQFFSDDRENPIIESKGSVSNHDDDNDDLRLNIISFRHLFLLKSNKIFPLKTMVP
jgi:hypothetical protein